ncbi:GTPase ObgE [Candidatus Marinamargulisbacteria bacterium SCGC AG-343-D04]|nr:GTPase ObgE [Candidatus Marinamargulisbacteria bacterium SCGC AG-343-D04]
MFVDTISLLLISGNGGDGSVSFRREKYVPRGGPDGGDGGRGGSIIFQTSSQLQSLLDLKNSSKTYKAKHGKHGQGKKKSGLAADDLVIKIPTGTIVYDDHKQVIIDLNQDNMTYVIAKGGRGGKGNARFATSINKAPTRSEPGKKGSSISIHLELRLLAQVGLIGLPNSGKSSLLRTLTFANPKIGNYPFTTLFPNLGTLKTVDKEIIIADIPGLIKGASNGQGLGHDFLRHIDRTSLLVHLIPSDLSPEICWDSYSTIREELSQSSFDLVKKPCISILSKCDTIDPDQQNIIVDFFKKKNVDIFPISSVSKYGIDNLIEKILKKSTS